MARRAPGATPTEVLRAIGGAQSQDPGPGRLQVGVRSKGLTADAVEHARIEERSIIRHWVMRNTVHLFPVEDFGWLTSLFRDRIVAGSLRRLLALGLTEAERDRALAAIRSVIERDGAVTRSEAMAAAERTGVEVNVERRTHLSVLTVVGGTACIGPEHGRGNTFVDTREWIGAFETPDRESALAELARRYFAAFAPASDRDFAKWSGLSLGECRAGMAQVGRGLQGLGPSSQGLFGPRDFDPRVPRSPAVRLLPHFDTYLMGYSSRAHAVGEAGERAILPGGGVLRPTICVDGRFVGTWSRKNGRDTVAVTLVPFDRLDEAWMPALERDAAEMARFEGFSGASVARSA